MSDVHVHRVQAAWKKHALIDNDTYLKWYADSIKNPDKFWGKHGKRLDWFKPYTKVKHASFTGKVSIKWFEDGQLNVSYNCIDRHLKKRGDQVAIIWEGDNPYDDRKITYRESVRACVRLRQRAQEDGGRGRRVRVRTMPYIPEVPMRCGPAHASGRSIRWCSAVSRQIPWPDDRGLPVEHRHHRRQGCARRHIR